MQIEFKLKILTLTQLAHRYELFNINSTCTQVWNNVAYVSHLPAPSHGGVWYVYVYLWMCVYVFVCIYGYVFVFVCERESERESLAFSRFAVRLRYISFFIFLFFLF